MAAVNGRRILYGALAGGVLWTIWSLCINVVILRERYAAAQQSGLMLASPRYSFFVPLWIIVLFVLAYIIAWLYASVRATQGAGPKTAAQVGFFVGFAAGFPTNFASATWAAFDRIFPLWWMLELWVGAILAALVAGWLYRE
jgi:hypothetical protein